MTVNFKEYEDPLHMQIDRFNSDRGYGWCNFEGANDYVAHVMFYDKKHVDHVGILSKKSKKHIGTIRFYPTFWSLKIFGSKFADEMKHLAEELSKEFDVIINAEVVSKVPKRRTSFAELVRVY